MPKNIDPRISAIIKSGANFGKKRRGRPPGSRTRPDAPSKLARLNPTTPAAAAAPAPSEPPRPDSELFGTVPNFERPPGDVPPADAPPGDVPPINEPAPEVLPPEPEETAESQRPLAMFIWDSIVNFLAAFIGKFWLPRPVGKNVEAGEIPYDERETVVLAFCKYLHEVGMAVLTPAQELWLAIGNYTMPRLASTLMVLKEKFGRKKPPQPAATPGDNRFAGNAAPTENSSPTDASGKPKTPTE